MTAIKTNADMEIQDFLANYDQAVQPKTQVLRGSGIIADNVFWYQPIGQFVDYSNWDGFDFKDDHLSKADTLISKVKDISLTVCAAWFDANDQKIYQSLVKDLDFYAFNENMAVPVVWYNDYFYGGAMLRFPHLAKGNYSLIVHEDWMVNGKRFNRYHYFKIDVDGHANIPFNHISKAINYISDKYDSGNHIIRDVYNSSFPFDNQSFAIYPANIPKMFIDVTSDVAFQKFNGTDEDVLDKMGLNSIERLSYLTFKAEHKDDWETLKECLAAKWEARTSLKFRTESDPSQNAVTFTLNYNEPSKVIELTDKKNSDGFVDYYAPVNLPI